METNWRIIFWLKKASQSLRISAGSLFRTLEFSIPVKSLLPYFTRDWTNMRFSSFLEYSKASCTLETSPVLGASPQKSCIWLEFFSILHSFPIQSSNEPKELVDRQDVPWTAQEDQEKAWIEADFLWRTKTQQDKNCKCMHKIKK